MAKALSSTETKQRLIKLRNFERVLYPAARARITKLEAEVKQLKAEKTELETKINEQDGIIQKLLLQVDALNTKVFGKKHTANKDKNSDNPDKPRDSKKDRSPESYRRPLPDESEVTSTESYPIDLSPSSPHYGHNLSETEVVTTYLEDSIPPEAMQLKTVAKHLIEKAYCHDCQVWLRGKDIPPQTVTLGENVAILVVYLSTVRRFSYQQIIEHVRTFFHIELTDSAIDGMLERQARKLRPACELLIRTILSQVGTHIDESHWKVAAEKLGHYVWSITPVGISRDTFFLFGQSRGKGTLTNKILAPLKDLDKSIIAITDDYGGYREVEQFLEHALCWAHPNRKLRELAESKNLSKQYRKICLTTYRAFNELYKDCQSLWENKTISDEDRAKRILLLKECFDAVAKSNDKDPPQLKTYKDSLRHNKECYFVCQSYPGIIPLDNNKAERSLRHLVIKRKTSFGSKTQKGADVLSVIYSVALSLYWRDPNNYFKAYREALAMSD
jgi:DNA repair exonuclease SbcCD ATPase subunit